MASTAQTQTDIDRYNLVIERIRRTVDKLNQDLGTDDDTLKIRFGYIGNSGPGFDDRSWSVFLPYSGRVDTVEDRIDSFRTGDLDGAVTTLNALLGFRRGLQFAGGPVMAEIRYRKAARIATDA